MGSSTWFCATRPSRSSSRRGGLLAGAAASGATIASLFGVTATASAVVAAGHVQVNLGRNASVPGASPSASASSSPAALPTTGAQGGAVIAKNGIPCVD